MVRNPTFLPLWSHLAEAARQGGSAQVITVDEPGRLRIETAAGRPFCEVRIQKGHVGVYLLAVVHLGQLEPIAQDVARAIEALEAFTSNLQGLVGQW